MENGIIDLPDSEYHTANGISVSQLKHADKSPKHYKHNLNNPQEQRCYLVACFTR